VSRTAYAILALATIAAGLLWRLAPLHLPFFLYKYGGSVLWAVMLYWIAALCRPRSQPLTLALIAAAIACAVELFRLIHTPALDAFRLTLAGKLLLGRVFSPRDIIAYWIAIALTAFIDARLRASTSLRNG
jgi:hypothetical protein